MKTTLEINFEQSLKAADALEELSGILLRTTESKYLEALYGVRRSWEGEAADVFLKKGDVMYRKLKHSAEDLSSKAEGVRRLTRKIHEAEQWAVRLGLDKSFDHI